MQDRMEEARRREKMTADEVERLERRENELFALRNHIQEQERQLDEYRARLKDEQLSREREFQKELEARERFFDEREKKLYRRQKEIEENLLVRQQETLELRERFESEIKHREAELQKARQELQEEKDRYNAESREKIERTSKDYVSEALETLGAKESEFHTKSRRWAALGATSLIGGLGFFGYITTASLEVIPTPVTWEFIVFAVFKGLIAVALFAALAKYSLIFSNSYMRESLKNADRRHAINFGKFYLESYGAAADWSQIKEAFEHWNITAENAFNDSSTDKLDVTTLEKVSSAIEKIGKSIQSIEKKSNA